MLKNGAKNLESIRIMKIMEDENKELEEKVKALNKEIDKLED